MTGYAQLTVVEPCEGCGVPVSVMEDMDGTDRSRVLLEMDDKTLLAEHTPQRCRETRRDL